MTFHRRSLALLVGLAALGTSGFVLWVPTMAPSTIQGASRQTKTPRRLFGRQRGEFPGRKGVAQKRQIKRCNDNKPARKRRRKTRLARR